jgi:molecular chaperone GrpE
MTAGERSEPAVELADTSLEPDRAEEPDQAEELDRVEAAQGAAQDADAATPQPTVEADDAADDVAEQLALELEELTAKAQRADEYLALAQRTQADFENYRKRAAREAAAAQERGLARLVKELLPAIDNLDRALKAATDAEDSQLAAGIRLVHSDLLAALARVGVEPFSPDGEPFDPQLHEAVAQQPVDGLESGLVAEVFQQGFRLGDSVLRPARVLVAA